MTNESKLLFFEKRLIAVEKELDEERAKYAFKQADIAITIAQSAHQLTIDIGKRLADKIAVLESIAGVEADDGNQEADINKLLTDLASIKASTKEALCRIKLLK